VLIQPWYNIDKALFVTFPKMGKFSLIKMQTERSGQSKNY